MKTSVLKIAIVALALVSIATPSFAQRGRGGGGGGGQKGGQQNGGQKNAGNPGGGNPGGGQHNGPPHHNNPGAGVNAGVGAAGVGAGATLSTGANNGPQHVHNHPNNPNNIQTNNNVRNNNPNTNQLNRNAGPNANTFNGRNDPRVNDPRVNDPRFRNDPRFNNNLNNNNGPRTFASPNNGNFNNGQNFNARHYDPAYNQFRLGNQTVNYGNPNYRPSYSRYSWYNGYQAGPYGVNGYGNLGNGSAYGVGYRGFGGNSSIGNTLLGLGLSSLLGGGTSGLGGLGGAGGYGGYGSSLGYPAGWGLGGWGLGSMGYSSGYLGYNNPYYSGNTGGNFAYNYAQPIPVAVAGQPSTNDIATQNFETARQQFRDGEYSAALASVDAGIKLQPTDAVMHEFRALTQFALGDYRNSAATIHSVLAVGPGWDWATLSSLYPSVDTYTTQLRALEAAVKENPKLAETRFLLGYQYMTAGHAADAAAQFKIASNLMPQDQVAADLSRLNSTPDQAAQVVAPTTDAAVQNPNATTSAAPAMKQIDPAALVGDWKAERSDGSKFDVELSPDKTFVWKFAQADKNQTLTGTYGIENDLLVLQSKDGGAMLGHVSVDSDKRFTFKLLGTPETDQGLAFNR
ncbi:MAG: hypothetical protein K8U03_22935 [Planctomycetia bacterium]|nr:hypothetical protein [Planctomycetia bacterium]